MTAPYGSGVAYLGQHMTRNHYLGDDMRYTPPLRLGAAVALSAVLILAGCSSGSTWHGDGKGGTSAKPDPNAPSATISFPANGASDVPASAEIAFTTRKAASSSVSVTDDEGKPVVGAMRPDGSSWLPSAQLAYGTKYTVKVCVSGGGKSGASTVHFTTMAKPGNLVSVRSQVGDDISYGVGMPIVINFGADIPKDQHANVERRLFVTSEPAQEGSWSWFNNKEIHFRPRDYWRANTKLSIHLATGGLPFGGDAYGAGDVDIHAGIGDKLVMTVDNATKTMSVSKNDQE